MKNFYAAMALLFVVQASFAQISPAYNDMREREMQSQQTMFGGEGPFAEAINGLDYDQVYARLELRLNPDTTLSTGKYVWGGITTYFKTGKTNFNLITFDMASALTCDSVYYHGVKLPAGNIVEQVDTLRITLPNIVTMGTLDSVKVFYKGTPPTVPTWTTTGFVRGGTTGSTSYIHTLSEPYSAYTWWPSKSRVAFDKFDSVDIIVSTPSAFRVAANGKRMGEPITGVNRVTTWKHRYPISTYQICIGVARYVQYPATPTLVNIGGTNMELYNLLWSNALGSSVALDRTAEMLTVMSSKFSDYPFKNEKYGHYTFGFGGGMEHNTFSGMGTGTYNASTDWDVIAHELGHQWWGGSVTCGSWRDIWVNEGFARYSEIVYLEGKIDASVTATPTSHRAT
ncbi:MAG TPA: M1 family aminopeptidase, partial [Ferruginibacter sp.]|nr:M1 family aminopeptidase [Ferruginibacter sp.]